MHKSRGFTSGIRVEAKKLGLFFALAFLALFLVAWQSRAELPGQPKAIALLTYTPSATATGTTTPVPTPTATPTSDVSLHLSIDLEGRPLPPAPAWETELEIVLKKRTAPAMHHVTICDELGTLHIEGLAPGLYDIRVRGINTLTNVRESIILSSGVNPVHMGLLRTGDLNGDEKVDILDFSQFRLLFGGSDAAGDLNNSGLIDILDFSLLRRNFGKRGPFVLENPDL